MNRSEGQWSQPELTFDVYRGLTREPTKGRDLGTHWSADPSVARRFAGQLGTVLHGEAPISAVETDTDALEKGQVFIGDKGIKGPPEKEVPLKPGKSVKVKNVTSGGMRVTPNWVMSTRQRTRTYNPPREMKA